MSPGTDFNMYQKVASNTISEVPINHSPKRHKIHDCLHGGRIESFEQLREREEEKTGLDAKRKTRHSKRCRGFVFQN